VDGAVCPNGVVLCGGCPYIAVVCPNGAVMIALV